MATRWPPPGQPLGSTQSGRRPTSGSKTRGPPPICFKCGCEGHFVVDCPMATASAPDGVAASHASQPNQPNGSVGGDGTLEQRPQWSNSQNGAPTGYYSTPKRAPIVTRYAVPGQPAEYANSSGPYPAPVNAAQFQQYQGSVPSAQPYPSPQQGPYQPPSQPPNQPYGPSGATYGYGQAAQQPYGASPPNPQYENQGYHPSPCNQYPQPSGPPQFGHAGYQNGPQPYAPPQAASPYQQSPNSYPPQSGAYSPPQHPPQWNNTQAPYSASQLQQPTMQNRPQYNANFKRRTSGPRKQFQPHHLPQRENGSEGNQSNSQTPAFSSNPTRPPQVTPSQNPHVPSKSEKAGSVNDSNMTSFVNSPQARRGSFSSNTCKSQTGEFATPSSNTEKYLVAQADEEGKQKEEGEVSEEDPTEQEFNWELETIFKESLPTENVALAQPLSTQFHMTPVPLLQTSSATSVSRYARKDNLKEFTRPIRSQPQWSYLQEDPGFSDAKMEGELIPLGEALNWTAKRQGVTAHSLSARKRFPLLGERKRGWSDDGQQDDADSGINLEISDESLDGGGPNKRQKLEEVDHEIPDTVIVQAAGTPTVAPGTPTLVRAGTPSLDTMDDVWAPQPGEGSISGAVNKDPTEALLASLGVSGSPKPVRKRSTPQGFKADDEPIHSQTDLPQNNSPQETSGYSIPPYHGTGYGDAQQRMSSQSQYGNGIPSSQPIPYGGPQHGNSTYKAGQQNDSHYDNRQYGMHRQNSYSNSMPPQHNTSYNNVPYSMPPQPQYSNGSPYGSAPSRMPQHGPYGDQPHSISPESYVPPQDQNPWDVSQQGNPYGQQPHGAAHYRNATYAAPVQAQYGNCIPPQDNPVNDAHQHSNHSYQPFNNSTQGNPPSRRNSSHANTRRPGSSGSDSNVPHPTHFSQGQFDGGGDTPSPPEKTPVLSEYQNSKTSETNEPDESPLTPTSAEILGKLIQPTRKASNDKKSESQRQVDDSMRKFKRPQPVVAEAYSRRW